MFGNVFSGKGQSKNDSSSLIDREPCVAGQFYPGTSVELKANLKSYFQNAHPRKVQNLLAIITPHAGYVYSGQVAAHGFNQIDPDKKYDRIFLIGSSHRTYFEGASIYNRGNYKSPLGKVEVDIELCNKLILENRVFTFREEAHIEEHSLEVQLPFLQYHIKTDFKIVPIIIAAQSEGTIDSIADALRPFLNDKNLFVISSDFSHYPSYEKANEIDHITAEVIALNSPEKFMEALSSNKGKSIPGLATSMCGWSSMLSLLKITSQMDNILITPIDYKNSGDAYFGDKSRVVGYWAITVSEAESSNEHFSLTYRDKKTLLQIARTTIERYLKTKKIQEIDSATISENLLQEVGAFVSLHNAGDLRGCIGRFKPETSLYKVVQDMAISAATEDRRFSPVISSELSDIDIEISVLTPMRKIESIDEIVLGRHGIYIKKGHNTGTFLPQVAESTQWSIEEFLGHCARDKARIGWDGWRDAEIYIYEAIIFDEKDFD